MQLNFISSCVIVSYQQLSFVHDSFRPLAETAFTRCQHILKTVKNVTDRPPVHTKTALFCRQILKTVDFKNETITSTLWKQHRGWLRKAVSGKEEDSIAFQGR